VNRYFWLFNCQSVIVLASLAVAVIALLALGWVLYHRPAASPPAEPASSIGTGKGISMPGQDGMDIAVSGCADETLGLLGHIDNHIRILGVRDLQALREVDISYPGARWHEPCSGGRGWQIVVVRSGTGLLDLYFESATPKASAVTYTVTLSYTDGTQEIHYIHGTSGDW
jgi:hypothetical protein